MEPCPLLIRRPLVCLDVETTGINPTTDRVIQVGLIKVFPDCLPVEYLTLVDPNIPIPPEATEVHHIDNTMVIGQPTFKDIALTLFELINDSDICGYNVDFDLSFLKAEFNRANMLSPVMGIVVDPFRIFKKMERYTLSGAVRFYLREELSGAHDALVDARAAFRVLEAQARAYGLESLEEARGVYFDTDVCLDPDCKFAWKDGAVIFNFGSMRGTPLKLAKPGLLQWVLNGEFSDAVKSIARNALNGVYPQKANPARG